jgi:hypothetical protein
MNIDEDIKTRINDKLDQIKNKIENLSSENYLNLSNKLWEVERETTLLREYIEKNVSDEEMREVI